MKNKISSIFSRQRKQRQTTSKDNNQRFMPQDQVVSIRATKNGSPGNGSAFLVAPNILITAWHVIEGAQKGTIIFNHDPSIKVLAGHRDTEKDICVILLDKPIDKAVSNISDRRLNINEQVSAGAYMYDWGKKKFYWEIDNGVFKGLCPKIIPQFKRFAERPIYLFSKLRPGYSGTPILDNMGKVIGMATAIAPGASNVDDDEIYVFATSTKELQDTLDSAVKSFKRKKLLPQENQTASKPLINAL